MTEHPIRPIALLWCGVVPSEVRVDRPEYEFAGRTTTGLDPDRLELGSVVAVAMGPLAAGESPPGWKPDAEVPVGTDEAAMGALVELLELDETQSRQRSGSPPTCSPTRGSRRPTH
jgi:hypothetical protein